MRARAYGSGSLAYVLLLFFPELLGNAPPRCASEVRCWEEAVGKTLGDPRGVPSHDPG